MKPYLYSLLSALTFTLSFILLLTSCSPKEPGTKDRPFAMYFVPSTDAQQIVAGTEKISEYVARAVSQKIYQKDEGFYIKASVPTSYIAVVEAFGTNKADFAALTTFSFILAKDVKKYPVEPIVTVVRGKDEKTYRGQIIVHKDSGFKTLTDLNGKKFAFTDPASTAGYLLPKKLFKDKGISLGETMFAQKHDNVVTMVYQKQVDAGSTYYSPPRQIEKDGKLIREIQDARGRVKTQFPDVEEKVVILDFTEESMNEPWVVRSNLFEDAAKSSLVKNAVKEALIQYSNTPEGKEVIYQLYNVSSLADVKDSDYDSIRKIVRESDLDLEAQMTKKK